MIQVRAAADPRPFADPAVEENGWMRVGDWRLQAETGASKPASLLVESAGGRAALAVDVAGIAVGSEYYESQGSESILVESAAGVRRSRDELPAAAQNRAGLFR